MAIKVKELRALLNNKCLPNDSVAVDDGGLNLVIFRTYPEVKVNLIELGGIPLDTPMEVLEALEEEGANLDGPYDCYDETH